MAVGIAAATALLAGCRKGGEGRSRHDTLAVAPTILSSGTLTDAGIVVLVEQLDAAAIGTAQVASPRVGTPQLRAFAQTVATDHQARSAELEALPVTADTGARPPSQLATLQAAMNDQTEELQGAPAGPAFDRLFVSMQLASHARMLDSLTRWRELARDARLRAALDRSVATARGHLQLARALQLQLNRAPDSAAPPSDSAARPRAAARPGRSTTARPDSGRTP